MQNHKEIADSGGYPNCYEPYPPFYNICTKGSRIIGEQRKRNRLDNFDVSIQSLTCCDCIRKNGFIL